MNIFAKIVLYPAAAFTVIFGVALANVIHEDLTYTPEQKVAAEVARYAKEESYCMAERPHSAARADCIWEAQRDYPQGYLLSLKNSLDAAREQHYNGNTN